MKNSTSIVELKNKDNMCLARAIAIGKAKADNHTQYDKIRDGRSQVQTVLVTTLCRAAGVDHTKPCGLEDLDIFQTYLKDYQICEDSKDHLFGSYIRVQKVIK